MSIEIHPGSSDLDAICRLAFSGAAKSDPALVRRIRHQAAQIRRETRAKHGVTNVAVDLVREVRDGE
jgi:hypothetical protein